MKLAIDNRKVVLLKSLRTNNRFYALVPPDSGYHNAEAIGEFPDDLPLGIAYPCLEDGLNDFAVIRTTFETIDLFPDDPNLRREMMAIIEDTRRDLRLRLIELRDRLQSGQAHFLGTQLSEFKQNVLQLVQKGIVRRTLDNMMKVDVYESVAQAQARLSGQPPEPVYRYEFQPRYLLEFTCNLPPRRFVACLFADILDAVEDEANYQSRFTFDRNVFQKFIGLMFIHYATTEPIFYGTHRSDYGVSAEKEMDSTPLYQAVGIALRELAREWREGGREERPTDVAGIFRPIRDLEDLAQQPVDHQRTVDLPSFAGTDQMLVQPLVLLAEGLRMLAGIDHERAREARELILRASRQLFFRLQEMGVISPVSPNPFDGLGSGGS
ncbi:MAG: hypothetical protein HY320_13270 [Armatimonadetes bacterium]|nr:hypothetical protein [Armatimonadota bacterium]